jgi:hypothetical protein
VALYERPSDEYHRRQELRSPVWSSSITETILEIVDSRDRLKRAGSMSLDLLRFGQAPKGEPPCYLKI